jgi:hypothetical protein
MNDVKEKRGYRKLKEEELDRTLWRSRFGRGCERDVRQTAEWVNGSEIWTRTMAILCTISIKFISIRTLRCHLNYSITTTFYVLSNSRFLNIHLFPYKEKCAQNFSGETEGDTQAYLGGGGGNLTAWQITVRSFVPSQISNQQNTLYFKKGRTWRFFWKILSRLMSMVCILFFLRAPISLPCKRIATATALYTFVLDGRTILKWILENAEMVPKFPSRYYMLLMWPSPLKFPSYLYFTCKITTATGWQPICS